MKASRIIKPKEPLQVQEIKTSMPRGSQVLIKVASSGVCHSDIHLWEGGYEREWQKYLASNLKG
jgi:propanol-preferring alcohol dehydrogenase